MNVPILCRFIVDGWQRKATSKHNKPIDPEILRWLRIIEIFLSGLLNLETSSRHSNPSEKAIKISVKFQQNLYISVNPTKITEI